MLDPLESMLSSQDNVLLTNPLAFWDVLFAFETNLKHLWPIPKITHVKQEPHDYEIQETFSNTDSNWF